MECSRRSRKCHPSISFDNGCLQAQVRGANGCHIPTWSRAQDYYVVVVRHLLFQVSFRFLVARSVGRKLKGISGARW